MFLLKNKKRKMFLQLRST